MNNLENKINDCKNKVIINLRHGLGNQLFQTALGLWATRGNYSRLIFDISWYDKIDEVNTIREILVPKILSSLNIPTTTATDLDILRPLVIDMSQMKVDTYLESIRHVADQTPVHVYGAGMNYRYVSEVIETMRAAFGQFDVNMSRADQDFFEKNFVIGIHVRLGDYLNAEIRSWIGVVNYQAQVREIEKVLEQKNCNLPVKFAIFSNGKIEHKFDREFIATEHGGTYNELETLKLMSKCSWLITANSTYSIFAAYLSNNIKGASLPKRYTRKREDFTYSLLAENMKVYDNDLI